MLRLTIKRITLGVATTIGLACAVQLQVPGSALADTATDQTAIAAAQAGVDYLSANQNPDGSVAGSPGATEWSTIAAEASGQPAANLANGSGASAEDFLKTDVPAPSAPATDVERNILAIAAIGADTSDFGGTDYNSALASYHNNNQIGDPTLLNDDIFGVMAAAAAGDPALKGEAQDGLDYFLAHQGVDGGFSYTTTVCAFCGTDSNDTAAAIVAMKAAADMQLSNPGLAASQANALAYLLSTQQADGGFAYDVFSPSDGSSTAWGLIALNSVGDAVRTQALAARDWLLANQNPDGGFSYGAFGITASDTYTTAHAVIALLGTTWLMQPSPIHATQVGGLGGGQSASDQDVSTTKPTVTLTAAISSSSASTGSMQPVQTSIQTPQTPQKTTVNKTSKPAKSEDKTTKSSTKYAVYSLVALAVIALAWYVLQSNLKLGKS